MSDLSINETKVVDALELRESKTLRILSNETGIPYGDMRTIIGELDRKGLAVSYCKTKSSIRTWCAL